MSTYEFTISLHIRHPAIDPHKITEMLGIEPQHMWQAGGARRGPAGEDREGVYRESYWTTRMEGPQLSSDGVSVEATLMQIASVLKNRAHGFLEQLRMDGGVAELHVSLFARGDFRLDLPAESLALLSRLSLAIALEVHLHTADNTPLLAAN